MQALSHKFYFKILPKIISQVGLGLHYNKLFSYGIDEDELWIFNTEDRLWDVPENVEYLFPVNRLQSHLNHNM